MTSSLCLREVCLSDGDRLVTRRHTICLHPWWCIKLKCFWLVRTGETLWITSPKYECYVSIKKKQKMVVKANNVQEVPQQKNHIKDPCFLLISNNCRAIPIPKARMYAVYFISIQFRLKSIKLCIQWQSQWIKRQRGGRNTPQKNCLDL